MRASAVVAITMLVLVSSGCKYISVLRRQGVDLTRRRQAVIVREAATVETVLPLDLTDLDEAEAVEVVAAVLESVTKIKTAAARSDAWLRPMQTDLRSIPPKQRLELDSEAEAEAHTSYCGLTDSKAHTQRWFRNAVNTPGRFRRGIGWLYRAAKWTLISAVLLLAAFGAVEWRGKRRECAARRQAMDVIDLAKQANGFVAGKATADKPALKCAYERDRTWRTKRKG